MLDALKSQVIVLQSNDILEAIRSFAASGNIHFPQKEVRNVGMTSLLFMYDIESQFMRNTGDGLNNIIPVDNFNEF